MYVFIALLLLVLVFLCFQVQVGHKPNGSNILTTGALWIEFLRYYTEKFDYENNIVTIRQYEPILRSEKGWFRQAIAIEDPFVLTHNLADKLTVQSQ